MSGGYLEGHLTGGDASLLMTGDGGSQSPTATGTFPVDPNNPEFLEGQRAKQVSFSFLYDQRADQTARGSCEYFNAASHYDIKRYVTLFGTVRFKDTMKLTWGNFVDKCPTENLVGTCDMTSAAGETFYYYKGHDPYLMQIHRTTCPKWTEAHPQVIPKPPPDTATWVLACDPRPKDKPELPEFPGGGGCIEFGANANANQLQVYQMMACKGPAVVKRCPTEKMTGRCDFGASGIQFYYSPTAANMGKGFCDEAHGAWSAP